MSPNTNYSISDKEDTAMKSKSIYYVYMYVRTKNSATGPIGSPYYIGKGNGYRAKSGKHRIIPSEDKSNIRIIRENLSEDDAFMWEVFWIAEFGRIDLGTGCLRNLTDGGEGSSGYRHSEVVKENQSKNVKNREKVDCQYCNKKNLGPTNYKRWHGENCKKAPNPINRSHNPKIKCEKCGIEVNAGLYAISHGTNCKKIPDIATCEFCNETTTVANLNRWHGSICKLNPRCDIKLREKVSGKGIKQSEAHIENNRQARLKQKKYQCLYCQLLCTKPNLIRWHNNNCKRKP